MEDPDQIRRRYEAEKIKNLAAVVPWLIIFLPIFFVVSPIIIFTFRSYFSDDREGALILVPIAALLSAGLMQLVIKLLKARMRKN